MIIDSLVIALGLDPKGVQTGMAKAQTAMTSGMGKITNALKSFAAPLIAAVGAVKLFNDYVTKADALGKFSASIGESITDIDAWGQAVQHAGGTSEGFQATVSSLTKSLAEVKNLGTGRAKAALDQLGISVTDAEGNMRKATDVMEELAEKGEKMDKAEFAGMLTKMGFDKGTIMLLQTGKIAVSDLVGQMKELSYTQEDAEVTAKFNDTWQDTRKSLDKVASIVLRFVVPALDWFLDKLKQLLVFLSKHEEAVVAFFTLIAVAITAMLIPALWSLFATIMSNPLTWLIVLIAALALVIEDLLVWVDGGESAFGDFWTSVLGSPEEAKMIWGYFKEDMKSLWDTVKIVGQTIAGTFTAIATGVGTAIGYVAAMIVGIFETVGQFIGDTAGALVTGLETAWNNLKAGVTVVVDFVKNTFRAGFEAIGKFIDTYIMAPLNKAIGLATKAKDFITGGNTSREQSDANLDLDLEKRREKAAAKKAEEEKAVALAQTQAVPIGAASSGVTPPGDTTNNIDNTSNTTNNSTTNVNATINVTSSDPNAAGSNVNKELSNLAVKSERSVRH
jgi:hypothetical protein